VQIGQGRVRLALLAVVVLVAAAAAGSVLVGGLGLTGEPQPTGGSSFATSSGIAIGSIGASPSGSPTAPSGSPAPSPTAFPPLAQGVIPIIYLHRVVAPPTAWLTWTTAQRRAFIAYDDIPAAFAAQLDYLKANGYTTILPRDLAAHWDHGAPLPPRPVILTFDDGSASWTQTILPMLQARGMVAEFYLTLTQIHDGGITWAQVRQLAAAGMGIGAHDVDHIQLAMLGPDRPPASAAVMWYQVHQVRLIIGQEIGQAPDSMAYVGGGWNATLVALVQKAGYTTARSIIRGITQSVANRWLLRVVAIAPHDDVLDYYGGTLVAGLPVFASKLAGISH